MSMKYVGEFKTTLRNENGGRLTTLIWGDPIHVLGESGGYMRVRARGREGLIDKKALSNRSLLEIYVIDVGQGDGVLMKTPDGKWHLIDAGVPGKDQMTKKGAANFLRWKFRKDLCLEKVSLENVIVTHPDYDHYGGLLDVLTGKPYSGKSYEIEVENFYHNGLGRFEEALDKKRCISGQVAAFPNGYHKIKRNGSFITELLDRKNSFRNPPMALEDRFAKLALLASQVPRKVKRLSHQDKYLPGYEPGDSDVVINVLGPILENINGVEGLRWLNNKSQTINGHSVVLRLDYGQSRILLTGDLNARSQRLLLSYHPQDEFTVDVAKGCHHGAEDMDIDFIEAMHARATVISSGDNENYSHPRPVLLGASAHYGRKAVGQNGEIMPPLLYSTELARSIKLAYAASAKVNLDRNLQSTPKQYFPKYIKVKPTGKKATFRSLRYTQLSVDLIYGLVNVRTDGEHILCATMEEKGNDFDIKVFRAGIEAENI